MLIIENLSRADLRASLEAIRLVMFLRVAKLDLSIDTERLTNYNFEDGVVFGLNYKLRLQVNEVHDYLISEMELLAILPVNKLCLNKVFHQVHEWAILPKT